MTHNFSEVSTYIVLGSNLLTLGFYFKLGLPRWGHCLQMVGELRMSLDMIYIMGFFISFTFLFAFYHFEHIYLIRGEIGHIKIWP
jgi:hypothetical protein